MKLNELNNLITNLENRGEFSLLATYYNQRSHLIESLAQKMKENISNLIRSEGLSSLNPEQFQIAQYLESKGELR